MPIYDRDDDRAEKDPRFGAVVAAQNLADSTSYMLKSAWDANEQISGRGGRKVSMELTQSSLRLLKEARQCSIEAHRQAIEALEKWDPASR